MVAVTYTVTFDTRAPAVTPPSSITVTSGQTYGTLPSLSPPTVTGATVEFNGWWTTATGGTEVTAATSVTITTNQTLYAGWTFNTSTHNIGATGPGTGIIFYIADGQAGRTLGFSMDGYGNPGDTGYFESYTAYYLEAATSDSGTAEWGAYGIEISGVTTITYLTDSLATKIGNGRKDTLTIVTHLGTSETVRAAQIASASSGGKDDWFLPSLGELYWLYQNKGTAGITIIGTYWSSSQANTISAWYQLFSGGYQVAYTKVTTFDVRAIRAF